MKASAIIVGLDIGGTRLKGGAINLAGRVLCRDVEATRPGQDLSDLETQLNSLVSRLIRRSGGALTAIGVSITGPVNPNVGCVYLPGKIRGLDRHKTVPHLRKQWEVPVTADNDGRLAAYAEWRAGAGRKVDNLLVFTLGTGIGSGVIMNGRLLTDRHFQLGTQCGHMVIDLKGAPCLTGAQGTGESMASVTALVQEVRSALARGLPLAIAEKPSTSIAFPDIVEAVRRKDPVTTKLFETWMDRFAAVMLNSYYAYVPDLILLAGGPTRASSLFLKGLERRLNAAAFRVPVGYKIPVRVAKLGEDAGWIGAALRVQELHLQQ